MAMITYRMTARLDDFRTADQIQPSNRLTVKRESKATEAAALVGFAELLRKNPPKGRDACAWCEVNDPKLGTRVLAKAKTKTSNAPFEWAPELTNQGYKTPAERKQAFLDAVLGPLPLSAAKTRRYGGAP